MDEKNEWFVGIDWGSETHQVAVVDREGKLVDEFAIAHDGDGLASMADRLLNDRAIASIIVGIETRWNAAGETLLERGVRVFSINPKQSDRFRDRHTASGAKDDRRDARVIAGALRTDLRAFREITLGDPRLIELRELSRLHDELMRNKRNEANRLYDQLRRIFPQLLKLASVHDAWLLSLVECAPTPDLAKSLSLAKIRSILRRAGVRKWTAEQVRDVLRSTPVTVAPGVTAAALLHIRSLLPRLLLLQQQLRDNARALRDRLDELARPSSDATKKEHRDVVILRSLPGVGMIVGATMLAEARDALVDRDYHRLRSICGTAPVTKQSGKSRQVIMRQACSRRLRSAMFHMAKTSVARDPRSKALYAAHRARGHLQGHALRVVADRSLKVLVAMLRSDTEYDPTKQRVAQVAT
jgi:transposase